MWIFSEYRYHCLEGELVRQELSSTFFFLIGKRIVSKRRNHQHLISTTGPTHVIVALTLAIQENNNLFQSALWRRERNGCILCLEIENFLELAAGLHQTRHCYHWLTPDTSSSSQTARAVLNRKKRCRVLSRCVVMFRTIFHFRLVGTLNLNDVFS